MPAILSVFIMESCCQSECQIGHVGLQVVEHLLLWFEFDDVWYVQLVHHHTHQVYVKALRLSIVIQIGVRPEVATVFIHQRTLLCVLSWLFCLGCCARGNK